MDNKRESTRVPLSFDVEVGGTDKSKADTRNLSLRGVYLVSDQEFKVGEDCELKLKLGEGEKAIIMNIHGRVVRTDEDGYGVEFISVDGFEALGHLQKLILYNSEDPQSAEEEIRQHIGIQKRPAE